MIVYFPEKARRIINKDMRIIIYDQDEDYQVDIIDLDEYDIDEDPEAVIDTIRDIIDSYLEDV
tara:strand:+ start:4411 stop:4599 length:189 start_codon:yes stop_codon:yes gene_type:complete